MSIANEDEIQFRLARAEDEETRITSLEAEGLTRSDAQGVVDAEDMVITLGDKKLLAYLAKAKPNWLIELTDEVRQAAKAFKGDWPDAWMFLGSSESNDAEKEWYDWPDDLLGLPVFHCPAWLKHSGYDGEHQKILPVWKGDVSDKSGVIREFECRLAKSGDF